MEKIKIKIYREVNKIIALGLVYHGEEHLTSDFFQRGNVLIAYVSGNTLVTNCKILVDSLSCALFARTHTIEEKYVEIVKDEFSKTKICNLHLKHYSLNKDYVNIHAYKDNVINGILEHFSNKEKSGAHKVDYKYIENMVSSFINSDKEEDLPFPKIIDTCWLDCYQNGNTVEMAVEKMWKGCRILYEGHMSVL